jgi:hypothetical protein
MLESHGGIDDSDQGCIDESDHGSWGGVGNSNGTRNSTQTAENVIAVLGYNCSKMKNKVAYSSEMNSGLNSQHMELLFGKPDQWNQKERQCRQDNIISLSGLEFYHPPRLEAILEFREDAWAADRSVAVPNQNITSCNALEANEPRSANTGGAVRSFESSRSNINEFVTIAQFTGVHLYPCRIRRGRGW